jgi:hypothetical protein
MDSLCFKQNSPKAFILTADSWSDMGPEEDQVWSLRFNHTASQPFHLYTTYGLQARTVQVYPEIVNENLKRPKNEDFKQAPTITQDAPGYLQIAYQLKNGLVVKFNTMVPEPSVLFGSLSLQNQSDTSLNFQLALVFHLLPLGKGQPTRAKKVGTHHYLYAQAGDLYPVLFMTGGPTPTFMPHPALTLPLRLAPGKSQSVNFALAAKHTPDDSLKTAMSLIAYPWQQAAQRKLMDQAQHTLQIRTGNPDWDAAFHLAQTVPYSHFVYEGSGEDAPFIVRNRLPDQPALKPNQVREKEDLTALELNHLAQVLLPQRADLLKSLVILMLNRVHKDGKLHSKRYTLPFLEPSEEPPLLAGLCLDIFEISQDKNFLREVLPLLRLITHRWCFSNFELNTEKPFTWQTSNQCQLHSGLDLFDIWEEGGRGLDIHFVESPALLAMLWREAHALKKIAKILEETSLANSFAKLAAVLEKAQTSFWHEGQGVYLYRDIETHNSPEGEIILSSKSKNVFSLDRHFEVPQRLICHLQAGDQRTRVCHLSFTGLDRYGQKVVEVFQPRDIRWVARRAHLTTQHLFISLQNIKTKGLAPEDEITLETVDLSKADITCLTPLWSGDLPETHIPRLLTGSLKWQDTKFNRGIPEVLPVGQEQPEGLQSPINILWNTLITQGLARNGCTEPAAVLFTNFMTAIIGGLRNYDGFYPYFQMEDGQPLGEKNAISGLAPIRLFLEIAGIRILSPCKVALWGHNPFPWPIEITWQGLSLRREEAEVRITFPDGTTCTCENADPVVITPESRCP